MHTSNTTSLRRPANHRSEDVAGIAAAGPPGEPRGPDRRRRPVGVQASVPASGAGEHLGVGDLLEAAVVVPLVEVGDGALVEVVRVVRVEAGRGAVRQRAVQDLAGRQGAP